MIKKNDIIELKIDGITNLGFGVGRSEGLAIFVSGAVTGDEVIAKIIKVSSSFAVARIEKIIFYSPLRDNTRCQNAKCQSCAYKLISYEQELKIKEEDVRTAFKKCGLFDVKVQETLPSPKRTSYRNKAQYPISQDKNGNYVVGFFAPKSHRVTEARHCPLAPEVFGDIINTLVLHFEKHKIPAYNEETGEGVLRHVYLRRGEVSGEILLTIVATSDKLSGEAELTELIKTKHPEVVGLLLNVNKKKTNVILGEKYITLFGRDYIYDTLAGIKLKLRAPAFYQVNHDGAELLYAKAKELANPKKEDTLLDLYCGAGSIGLSMARDVRELIGIEIVEDAVLCARENARAEAIENAHFFTGDAEYTEKLLENAERELGRKISPNIVILDPPRAGCDEKLIKYVSRLSPDRIVYISCNPQTLARDVALFFENGYFTDTVLPVDMFCMTGHVESVVALTRRLDNELRERMN